MTVHFVRHGQSAGNVNGVIQGSLDVPLTAHGQEQARQTALRLGGWPLRALYSSPLRRAAETAAAIGVRCGLSVTPDPDLTEYRFGEAEGLPWDEAKRRWRLDDGAWGRGLVPGEEGTAAFRLRIQTRLVALLERHADDEAVCVVHGGVIGAVVAMTCDLPGGEHAQIYTGNCGITSVGVVRGQPTLLRVNDCCHLDQDAGVATPAWQRPAAP